MTLVITFMVNGIQNPSEFNPLVEQNNIKFNDI